MNPTSMEWRETDELAAYQLRCVDDYVYDSIAECDAGDITNEELVDIFGEAYECGDIDQDTYDMLMDRYG